MLDEDLELLKLAKSGDQEALNEILIRNKSLVTTIARKYYLLGGEKEDLVQEGMIGFFKAINSFNFEKNDNFKNYAIMLIQREMVSAIRKANSSNNQVMSDSVYLDDTEFLSNNKYPELDILSEETCNEISDEIKKNLSSFENQVVKYFLKGYTYTDIAKILNKTPKAIDNALSRIKTKLKYLKEIV